ncbi:hypothetical protein V1264_007074 [Littorina saxatilis]|uniref:Uncharacterized protein n=1 Tax=Littorina saxatilis TaxID=31220 RepID=A0AAN9AVF5_9CAEN
MTTKRDGTKKELSEGIYRLKCRDCGGEFIKTNDRRDDDFSQQKAFDPIIPRTEATLQTMMSSLGNHGTLSRRGVSSKSNKSFSVPEIPHEFRQGHSELLLSDPTDVFQ